jgi:hypothetical protein
MAKAKKGKLEKFTVTFPDGTKYTVDGIWDGERVLDADGRVMFEVKENK